MELLKAIMKFKCPIGYYLNQYLQQQKLQYFDSHHLYIHIIVIISLHFLMFLYN